jgi:hypothetical protein
MAIAFEAFLFLRMAAEPFHDGSVSQGYERPVKNI